MPIQIGQRPDHGFDEPLGLLSDCHRRIEHFLHVLVTVDARASGGPLTDDEHRALQGAITYFANAAPRHTADEEVSLFPRLRQCADAQASDALEHLEALERDHRQADEDHAAVDVLVRRWLAADRLSGKDAADLRARLARLQTLYQQHIAIEDKELFPAAARLLTPSDLEQVGREMAERRDVRPRPLTFRPGSASPSRTDRS